MTHLILGMGSGRCGTYSLTKVLEKNGVSATHENFCLPWEHSLADGFRALCMLLRRDGLAADVAFYWLNYVDMVVKYVPEPRFICLKRDRGEVVESFYNRSHMDNFWTDPKSVHWDWDSWVLREKVLMMPKYDLPKKEAIGAYWDDYYRIAHALERQYPNYFRVYDFRKLLNDEGVQHDALIFCGIKEPNVVTGVVSNATGNTIIEQNELPETGSTQKCGKCGERTATWMVSDRTHSIFVYVCGHCREPLIKEIRDMFGG